MRDYSSKVNTQYGRERLADQILSALRAAGKNLDEECIVVVQVVYRSIA